MRLLPPIGVLLIVAAAVSQPATAGVFVSSDQCRVMSVSPPRYRLSFSIYKTHPFGPFCRMRIEPTSRNGSQLQPITACLGPALLPGVVESGGSALYQPSACLEWSSFHDSLWIEVEGVPAYFVATIDTDDPYFVHVDDVEYPCTNPVGVEPLAAPVEVRLGVAPNPARVTSEVTFAQPREGRVRIGVFDLAGRRVRSLADLFYPAGEHRVSWDLRDDAGFEVTTGMYLVRLETSSGSRTRSVLRLR